MEKSADEGPAVVEIEITPSPPEGKRLRRCVQSKLPWGLPLAEAGNGVVEVVDVEIGEQEGEESDWESKGKQKRKRNSKPRATRKYLVTSKEAGLSPIGKKPALVSIGNNNYQDFEKYANGLVTPKKGHVSSDVVVKSSQFKQRVVNGISGASKDLGGQGCFIEQHTCDLRLEVNTAAKENMQLSAGKQIHPFFTCRKTAKRLAATQDSEQVESRHRFDIDQDGLFSCPPVHVIDRQVVDISLDWSNWEFLDNSFIDSGHRAFGKFSSVNEGKLLSLDSICFKGMQIDESSNTTKRSMASTRTPTPALAAGQEQNEQPFADLEVDLRSSFSLPTRCGSSVGNLENNQQDKLFEERRCNYWPEGSLWTDKYQPENAAEVCGNHDSVRLLTEWLKSWHGKCQKNTEKCMFGQEHSAEESEISFYEDESDMVDREETSNHNNVLLITGPVGSGKSAAVYACAKEQGFEVIEVNTSDMRNGAYLKLKFGDSMDSHGLNRWSAGKIMGPSRNNNNDIMPCTPSLQHDKEFDNSRVKVTSRKYAQDGSTVECSWNIAETKSSTSQVANKTLILFEDVDTVFDEDSGFVSTILQLAENAKRPIILTSNRKGPTLPPVLDPLILDFKCPLNDELFRHVDMICASEEAHVSAYLLKHVIRSCSGDIRKTLMLLQFWCQGKIQHVVRNMKGTHTPIRFDIDAVHMALPKVIHFEFLCGLSQKVMEEINITLTLIEEKKNAMELKPIEMCGSSKVGKIANANKRKKTRLKRNSSIFDSREFPPQANDLDDFTDTPEFPEVSARRRVKQRPRMILSSLSDDGLSADELPSKEVIPACLDNCLLPVTSIVSSSQILESPFLLELPAEMHYQSGMTDFVQIEPESTDTASVLHTYDTFILQDVSCVPESLFESETEVNKRDNSMSLAVSSNYITTCSADLVQSIQVSTEAEHNYLVVNETSFSVGNAVSNTNEVHVESINSEELGDSQFEVEEPQTSGYQLMDECSRAEFRMSLASGNRINLSPNFVSVQETWQRLRGQREDLKFLLCDNWKETFVVVKLASELTDLISVTDIMLNACYPLFNDILEPSLIPAIEPDASLWHDEQFKMGSTYAQHGLSFHMNNFVNICSDWGFERTETLAEEMLASSTSQMASGKLLNQRSTCTTTENTSQGGLHLKELSYDIPIRRKPDSGLLDALLPLVPARMSMTLRGPAFHDYLTFTSHISKLGCSQLSEHMNEIPKRRSRASRHYLSTGQLSLSPEDVQLLARCSCFKEAVP